CLSDVRRRHGSHYTSERPDAGQPERSSGRFGGGRRVCRRLGRHFGLEKRPQVGVRGVLHELRVDLVCAVGATGGLGETGGAEQRVGPVRAVEGTRLLIGLQGAARVAGALTGTRQARQGLLAKIGGLGIGGRQVFRVGRGSGGRVGFARQRVRTVEGGEPSRRGAGVVPGSRGELVGSLVELPGREALLGGCERGGGRLV